MDRHCPKKGCAYHGYGGGMLRADDNFCPDCSTPIERKPVIYRRCVCGHLLSELVNYCSHCRRPAVEAKIISEQEAFALAEAEK